MPSVNAPCLHCLATGPCQHFPDYLIDAIPQVPESVWPPTNIFTISGLHTAPGACFSNNGNLAFQTTGVLSFDAPDITMNSNFKVGDTVITEGDLIEFKGMKIE
jgi:hypothetical protein